MVRVNAPLLSFAAHGWLGRTTYGRIGIVKNPYPIDFFAFKDGLILHRGTWTDKKIRWSATNFTWDGQRPNIARAFLSHYYNRKGWCYQRRRTWHGIIYCAMSPPISVQPNTPAQQAGKTKFANSILAWQTLSDLEKGVWNSYSYPKRPTGYNRFISAYMKDKPGLIK